MDAERRTTTRFEASSARRPARLQGRQQRPVRRDRVKLQVQRDERLHELRTIDAELDRLTNRRIAILGELDDLRRSLWPRRGHLRGRQPPEADEPHLPPEHPNAIPLGGRGLRATSRAVLRAHGPLPLRDLHMWLHHYGYRILSDHPVKRLSDALRYEVERGRVLRVERGVYAIDPGARPSRWRSDAEPTLEPPGFDPDLALDPASWPKAPGQAADPHLDDPNDPPGTGGRADPRGSPPWTPPASRSTPPQTSPTTSSPTSPT